DSLWNEWCNLAVARSIPGSLEFVRLADSLGFYVYYLSNRKEAFVLQGTIKNLQDLGFPQVEEKNMLLRKFANDKEPRRKIIQEDHEICLLIGDNLGDFFTDAETPSERDEQVSKFADRFGENYIILPNAMYGNWVQSHSLFDDPRQTKILLDSMVKDFDIKLLEKSE
ncbi:MAG: HAD family acid phosphatase, partial [Bacteroidales bacterium]